MRRLQSACLTQRRVFAVWTNLVSVNIMQKLLTRHSQKPYGMVLISGPTGSGKSTTLYAMLSRLNKEGVNIVTLEDPVEYFMEGINQSQVRPEIEYTFASGLRQILRQDPDIIMVGEIRDNEICELGGECGTYRSCDVVHDSHE